jgi:hypothetical protein
VPIIIVFGESVDRPEVLGPKDLARRGYPVTLERLFTQKFVFA